MVQVSVTEQDSGKVVRVDVSEDTTVEVLKAIVEVDFDVPVNEQVLFLNGNQLKESSKTMGDLGIDENSMIALNRQVSRPQPSTQGAASASGTDANSLAAQLTALLGASLAQGGSGAAQQPSAGGNTAPKEDEMYMKRAEELLTVCKEDGGTLGVLSIQNPPLGDALRAAVQGNGSVEGVMAVLKEQHEKRLKIEQEKNQKVAAAIADPLSLEAQAFLEDQIHQQHVDQNYELAQEHLPEAFGMVVMLYVDVEVNGIPIKAFVDSGAQSTIMSGKCAERCNLLRLVDKRFQGIAQGVGTSKIIGRIHMAQIKIGQQYFPASFTVLEDEKVDFLFGLDMLKRYQCCIDLEKDVLQIGGQSVPFLSEKDLTSGLFGRLNSGLSPGQRSLSLGADATPKLETTAQSRAADISKAKDNSETAKAKNTSPTSAACPPVSPGNSNAGAAGSGGGASSSRADEQGIKKLLDLGFDRSQAVMALEQTGGDAELAAALLFQQNSFL